MENVCAANRCAVLCIQFNTHYRLEKHKIVNHFSCYREIIIIYRIHGKTSVTRLQAQLNYDTHFKLRTT